MGKLLAVSLADRGLIRISGDDIRPFLQGLISNDVNHASPDRALYAAFLTPQGKYLHDLFVFEMGGALYLDCEKHRLGDLLKRLRLYKLRSKIELADTGDDWAVFALLPGQLGDRSADAFDLPVGSPGKARALDNGGAVFADPRLSALGHRCVLPSDRADAILADYGAETVAAADYDRLRISLGVPDGSRDMPVEKAVLLEYGFDELNGIDWDKGCFMGQELTARTRYRGLVRKRLLPVQIDGPLPEPGTPINQGGKDVGDIRTGIDDQALAYLRLEALANETALQAADAIIRPAVPAWARLPEQADTAG